MGKHGREHFNFRWKRDLDDKCRLPGGGKVPCLLLANKVSISLRNSGFCCLFFNFAKPTTPTSHIFFLKKCDLRDRRFTLDEIETFHRQHGFIGWTETSAKDDTMVKDRYSNGIIS